MRPPARALALRAMPREEAAIIFLHLSSFAIRWTVPVPMPSDLATFKIPTPFASCFRTLAFGRAVYLRPTELHALGNGALEACFDSLANHAPLKFSKGRRRR